MVRRGEKKPEDLNRPEGNDLKSNYLLHDRGEAELIERLEAEGYYVADWGIDRREDDGDTILYDDAMDFAIYEPDESAAPQAIFDEVGGPREEARVHGQRCRLVGLVDVKTKSSAKWMGKFNLRHYDHYYEHAERFDVPVFVVMFQLNESIEDEFVFHLDGAELYENVKTSTRDEEIQPFPDHNQAVFVPPQQREGWDYLERELSSACE